jgi:hypothetical protein
MEIRWCLATGVQEGDDVTFALRHPLESATLQRDEYDRGEGDCHADRLSWKQYGLAIDVRAHTQSFFTHAVSVRLAMFLILLGACTNSRT